MIRRHCRRCGLRAASLSIDHVLHGVADDADRSGSCVASIERRVREYPHRLADGADERVVVDDHAAATRDLNADALGDRVARHHQVPHTGWRRLHIPGADRNGSISGVIYVVVGDPHIAAATAAAGRRREHMRDEVVVDRNGGRAGHFDCV